MGRRLQTHQAEGFAQRRTEIDIQITVEAGHFGKQAVKDGDTPQAQRLTQRPQPLLLFTGPGDV
jgi:hypothetical protein